MSHQLFKTCPMCDTRLSSDMFHTRMGGVPSSYCKQCMSAYCRAHYRRNVKKHNTRRFANAKRYRQRNKNFVIAYLQTHPCVDCGETDLAVLEFDHVAEKRWNLSFLAGRDGALETIREEIKRCEVRCANCHRRRTARQFGWAKGSVMPTTGRSSAW